MPLQAYRASRDALQNSTGRAGAHVARNKTLWMIIFAVIGAIGFYLNGSAPGREPSHWGDVGALGVMLLGIMVMMKENESRAIPDHDEDDDMEAMRQG